MLLTKDGFIQGYNAQAAVDGAKQIIVAHGLTQSMSDCPQLVPLVDAVRANLGRKPREISADAGYCMRARRRAARFRPILSNLVLDDLDKELARRGHRFCRYPDDCNMYVRSRRAG